MKWQRLTSFEPNVAQKELWIYQKLKRRKEYNVEVTLGKDIDILSLKANLIEDFAKKVAKVRTFRTSAYKNKKNLERVNLCPVCGTPSNKAKEILSIYGARYYLCGECCHYYLLYRPTEEYLNKFYKTNKEYQSTYADKRTLNTRIEQVVMPKAIYVLNQYRKRYGRLPESMLDVGAGSGHFVYACRKLGIRCQGIEISESGRKFAKDNFNIKLLDNDFFKDSNKFNCDVVTFWGVIEHLSRPVEMLKASRLSLRDKGMVTVEVPRWNCFSTAVHTAFPDSVVRHLDPMDHIQCFSDSSLATAFVIGGLDIMAAWYFGMDAFELMTQLGYRLNENKIVKIMADKIPVFQQSLDLARLSDFMILTGTPQG